MLNIIILVLLLVIIFYIINKFVLIENFFVSTWTPYYVDIYNQPGYTNYLYRNGYMYPVF